MYGNQEIAGPVIVERGVQRDLAPSVCEIVAAAVNNVGRRHRLVVGGGREGGAVHKLHIDRDVVGLAGA